MIFVGSSHLRTSYDSTIPGAAATSSHSPITIKPSSPEQELNHPSCLDPSSPPFGGFMVVFQQQLHPLLSNLCFTYFPAAIICGSAVWRRSAALSRETRDAHGDIGLRTLQKEAELVTQCFLCTPGREKGGFPAHGLLRNVWDPSQRCSGLGGFESSSLDITSGNHNKDKRHHRLLCKQRRIRWVITSASKKRTASISAPRN